MSKIIFPTATLESINSSKPQIIKEVYDKYIDGFRADEKANRKSSAFETIGSISVMILILAIITLVVSAVMCFVLSGSDAARNVMIISGIVAVLNIAPPIIFYNLYNKVDYNGAIFKAKEYLSDRGYKSLYLYEIFEDPNSNKPIEHQYEKSIKTLTAIKHRIENNDDIRISYHDKHDDKLNFELFINNCKWDNFEIRCTNEDDFNSLTKHASEGNYDFSYIDKYCTIN